MADVTSQALVPPPTALFPQPPQQQPALSSNPGQMLDLLGKIQQNYQLQQELKARAAIGQAYQGSLQPDGTLDPQKLTSGLRNPDAAWALPETMTHFLQQQGSQFDILARQDQAARSLIGSLPPNATDEDLRHYAVTGVRAGIPAPIMQGHVDSLMRLKGDARSRAIGVLQSTALGPAGVSERVTGPPTDTGAPTQRSKGATILEEAGGTPPPAGGTAPAATSGGGFRGGTPTGLPPGGVESAQEMRADLSRQGQLLTEMVPWKNALSAADSLRTKYGAGVFGPGSEGRQAWESYLQSFSPMLARLTGIDPEKLRDYENARKYLTMSAQQRAATMGHGTNEQLATSLKATPNVSMNDLSVDDLIKVQIAMRRAEYAQVQQSAKKGGPGYTEEKSKWPAQNDIRAFSLDLLTPEARAKLLGSLKKGTPEYERFHNSLRAAYDTGVMDGPGTPAPAPASKPVVVKPSGTRPAPGFISSTPAPPAGGGKGMAPAPPAPAPGSFEDRWAPLPGARPGVHTDGRRGWFIPDPSRPGKYLAVVTPESTVA